jgi:hypothetical protein
VDEGGESCKTIYVSFLLKLLDTTLYYKVCSWFATGRWFSPGVEETGVPGENHRPVANHEQTL